MDSDDMVFVEGEPSTKLSSPPPPPSPPAEPSLSTKQKDSSETPWLVSNLFTPSGTGPPSFNSCNLSLRQKPGDSSHTELPGSCKIRNCCYEVAEPVNGNTFTMTSLQSNEAVPLPSFLPPLSPPPPPPPGFLDSQVAYNKALKSKRKSRCIPPPQALPPGSMAPPPHPPTCFMAPPPPPPPHMMPPPLPVIMSPPPPSTRPLPVVTSPAELIEGFKPSIVQISPYKREVLTTFHRAYPTDFEEFKWLLQYGETEVWYSKPRKSLLNKLATYHHFSDGKEALTPCGNALQACLEFPKVWISSVLTTEVYEDDYDSEYESKDGARSQCTAASLSYYLVFATSNRMNMGPELYGRTYVGETIFKLVRCGSREAATAETFYASGVNGLNLVFSCVMRQDQALDTFQGKVRKVDELSKVAERHRNVDLMRVFY